MREKKQTERSLTSLPMYDCLFFSQNSSFSFESCLFQAFSFTFSFTFSLGSGPGESDLTKLNHAGRIYYGCVRTGGNILIFQCKISRHHDLYHVSCKAVSFNPCLVFYIPFHPPPFLRPLKSFRQALKGTDRSKNSKIIHYQ